MDKSPDDIAAVSTHSRPKAAGAPHFRSRGLCKFQHTAARRRLGDKDNQEYQHSRFQHTAARRRLRWDADGREVWHVSTHSRPKAAGKPIASLTELIAFQHTAARRRLFHLSCRVFIFILFQHTAARRRLPQSAAPNRPWVSVSTHSRPKAAEPLSKALLHQVSQP